MKLRGSKGNLLTMTFRCCQAVYKSLEVIGYMTDAKGAHSDRTPQTSQPCPGAVRPLLRARTKVNDTNSMWPVDGTGKKRIQPDSSTGNSPPPAGQAEGSPTDLYLWLGNSPRNVNEHLKMYLLKLKQF